MMSGSQVFKSFSSCSFPSRWVKSTDESSQHPVEAEAAEGRDIPTVAPLSSGPPDGEQCTTPVGVSTSKVRDERIRGGAAGGEPTSVYTGPAADQASTAEYSCTQRALSGTATSVLSQSAVVSARKVVPAKGAGGECTQEHENVASGMPGAPGEELSYAGGGSASYGAAGRSESEVSAAFLATRVETTGVAREVSGGEGGSAQLTSFDLPFVKGATKTIGELEGSEEQQVETLSGDVPVREDREDLHTDILELHRSPVASLLIFALYNVFFFVAGFSLATASSQLPASILSMVEQRCAGTPKGGICLFSQGIRGVAAAGVAVGCVFGGSFADSYGRKALLCVSNMCLLLGQSLPLATSNFPAFCVSRFFFGVGLGGGLLSVSTFLVECVPASARGLSFGIGKLITLIGGSCTFDGVQQTYGRLLGDQKSRFRTVLGCASAATCVGAGFLVIFPTLPLTEEEWFAATGGLLETVGVLLSTVLVDGWGRSPLIRLGTIGTAVGFSAASAGCFWQQYISGTRFPTAATRDDKAGDTEFSDPALSLVLVGFLSARLMQNISWSTLLPVIVTEVLPTSVRATGAGFALGLKTALELTINITIPCLLPDHTVAVTLIAYAVSSYMAVALVIVGLPEGKGYRLEELSPEMVGENRLGLSNVSSSRQMQQLQEHPQPSHGQESSSPQCLNTQLSFAGTTAPPADAETVSSDR